MPMRTYVEQKMSAITECHCPPCDDHPDPGYPEFGGMVEGQWWCEWCLSCGCHNQGPSCSLERFPYINGKVA